MEAMGTWLNVTFLRRLAGCKMFAMLAAMYLGGSCSALCQRVRVGGMFNGIGRSGHCGGCMCEQVWVSGPWCTERYL